MELDKLLKKFGHLKIMVIGDLMLDKYQYGDVDRISPEAPVPVVLLKDEIDSPGGAANVVKNLSGLGIQTLLVGTIGGDETGSHLRTLLDKIDDVDLSGVVTDPERQTTSKFRIIGNHQQIVRIDREDNAPISGTIFHNLSETIQGRINEVSAVILSDYGKGVITRQLIRFVLGLKRKHKLIVSVDPKTGHFFFYKGVDLITPNNKEAGEAAGMRIQNPRTLKTVASRIRSRLKCGNLLITHGPEGMTLYNAKHGSGFHIPTVARKVYDVSGAGDTVISLMTAGMAAGLAPEKSARFANFSAGIVVGEPGTTAISIEKLRKAGLKSF